MSGIAPSPTFAIVSPHQDGGSFRNALADRRFEDSLPYEASILRREVLTLLIGLKLLLHSTDRYWWIVICSYWAYGSVSRVKGWSRRFFVTRSGTSPTRPGRGAPFRLRCRGRRRDTYPMIIAVRFRPESPRRALSLRLKGRRAVGTRGRPPLSPQVSVFRQHPCHVVDVVC